MEVCACSEIPAAFFFFFFSLSDFIHHQHCAPWCASLTHGCLLVVTTCGLFWRLFLQPSVPRGAGGVSYPMTGDRRRKRAVPSWPRSSCLPRCWRCTRSRTACITICRGSTTLTCSSPPRLSSCAIRRGAACWRFLRVPGLMSPASVTSPASPTASPKTTTTTSS